MRRLSIKVALPLLLGIASSVAVACGDNNTPTDTDTDSTDISEDGGGEPGSGGTNGDGSGATSSDGAGGGSGGNSTDGDGGTNNGGEGGQTNTGGTGTGGFGEVDLPDCDEDANSTFEDGDNEGAECWDHSECKGVASEQFLNRCSGTCLEFFDNEERIVGFDGDLPPL